jgi:hypothetical protein
LAKEFQKTKIARLPLEYDVFNEQEENLIKERGESMKKFSLKNLIKEVLDKTKTIESRVILK